MSTLIQLTAQLTEAREAYHALITGQAVVRVQRDGRSVEFSQANRADLRAYIAELESALGTKSSRRRPARFCL